MAMSLEGQGAPAEYLRFVVDDSWGLTIFASGSFLITLAIALIAYLAIRMILSRSPLRKTFELNEAEFGIGSSRVRLRPNELDRQIAYQVWVELSTRKIGLPIDLDHDVIGEIYDSWYQFFTITRELIKDIPVSKFRRKDTERIIRLSMDVLNEGVRPHLTQWQARFRRWFEREIAKDENSELHLQDIQKQFPDFDELASDLQKVNKNLMGYRQKMYELVSSN